MLSTRATAWLAKLGVTQRRPRRDDAAMRRYIAEHSIPAWPALLAVEANFGGLATPGDADRVFDIGVADWFGARREIDGRPHLLVAIYSPISWFMDESGRILEIDDLGERFYESDSIAHRIEQLSLFDWHGRHIHRAHGARGGAVARALDLVPIVEASDSRQRFWVSRDASATTGVLVRESLEPHEYGKRALVQLTWITAGTRDELDRAIACSTADEPADTPATAPASPTRTMQLVAALVDFHAVHRPLLDHASTHLGYSGYPPYQWAQTGTAEIAGSKWAYSRLGDTGYRLENAHGVVVEIPEILERTFDSIVVRSFTQYLVTKGVGRLVLEREEVDPRDTDGLVRLLDKLASTHLLERVSPEEYRLVVCRVDVSATVRLALEVTREHFAVALDPILVEGVIRELLWGPRETWRCVEMGLITLTEGANLVVAHLHSRLIRREVQTVAGWEAPLVLAVMQLLTRLGPQAFAIDLIERAMQEVPRLDARQYDSEDNIRPILTGLCAHLWKHRLVELTFRVGLTYLPVGVTVLGTLLEQLPRALGAIATRQPFTIDMREQALQMLLAFTAIGDEYTMVAVSPIHQLEGGTIGAPELLQMLLAVRTRFLALLLKIAPALEHHASIRAWLSARDRD